MAQTHPKLMASYFTVAGNVAPMSGTAVSPHSLAERAKAAADAGYVGMGLLLEDLEHLIALHGYKDIRNIIADAGLEYLEFEVLLDWFADGDRRVKSDSDRAKFLKAAEELGAYQLKIGGDITGDVWPIERMAESFDTLARQAADAGTMVTLEIFPESNVRDLQTAMAIVGGTNPAHGGLLVDIWHMYRGGIDYADVAKLPGAHIRHVELDDADGVLTRSIMEDTLNWRKLPGEGDFDVPAFLQAIAKTGYQGLYGVEILSADLRKLSPQEAARRSYDATLAQFEKAGLVSQPAT